MTTTFHQLARRQISQALASYAAVGAPPRGGWIAALREALDMTVRQFAARLGVAPSNVVRLEQRERDETISLGALRRAANALDCDLIYAVVPRRPVEAARGAGGNLLDSLIAARAREVATAEIGRVAHTMALEDQTVRAADLQMQIAERALALAETPRRLWDADVAPRTKSKSAKRGRPRRGA